MISFLCLLACNSNAGPQIPETTPPPLPSPAPKVMEELPNLKSGRNRSGCDNGPGVMGAASYFVGEIVLQEGSARGTEEWVLFANKKWAETNGKDCSVKWTLTGSKTSTQACGRCDFGVSLTNTMDITGSDCPKDMAKGETNQQIGYDIDLKDDGTVDVFFSRSGKRVGEGYHKDGTIRYVTDMSCRWF